jgi:hypothetical protein
VGRERGVTANNCEYEGCGNDAWYEINAQWSVVDFVSYQSCLDHLHDFYEGLAMSSIDGQYPAEIWTTTYDLEPR